MNKIKTGKQIERYFKGVSNHWRIDILLLIEKNPEINVFTITELVRGNFNTISIHLQKLVQAGLVNKHYLGRNVLHVLSPYGKRFAKFIQTFQHS